MTTDIDNRYLWVDLPRNTRNIPTIGGLVEPDIGNQASEG